MKDFKDFLEEAAPGHTMEAHGVKGMKNTPWRKSFKSHSHAHDWAEKNDAEIHGTRDLEKAKKGNLSPSIKEGLKPEHNMRPGWMIKADPVLKAKIEANKKKQKEMKAILGKKLKEDLVTEDAYKEAETYKNAADAAKKKGDTGSYHAHMANHHDAMAEWNSSKGRESVADSHMKKSEEHHDAFLKHKNMKEEVEQIDELSSDTLQKYKTAAHKSISNAAVKRHAGEMGSSEYRKNQDKRSKGINRADADKRLGTYKDKTPKKLDISGSANDIQKKYHSGSGGSRMSEEAEQIDELSNDTLSSYKKKAGESASEADKKGDFEKGNKRFKGIMKATFKQFVNDAKK